MAENIYDVAIIGGGPAGLTAAIYCTRKTLSTVFFEPKLPGGALALSDRVENYPGFRKASGAEIGEKMLFQATDLGATHIPAQITEVKKEGKNFILSASGGKSYSAKALVLATGASYRHLGIPGEKEFANRGVSFCATCDAAFFRGKEVAVIGGGDSAFTSARLLTDYAKKVWIIHRRDDFRAGDKLLVEEVKKLGVEFLLNKEAREITGGKSVEALILHDAKTGEDSSLQVGGVFINVGFNPENAFAKSLGAKVSEAGYVIVDSGMRTGVPGLFAIGDLTGGIKQAPVSAGHGAIVSEAVYDYVRKEQ